MSRHAYVAPLRICVENRPELLVIEAMFADCVAQGLVLVEMSWTLSSAIGLAEKSLLEQPHRPVALVANCPRASKAPSIRNPIEHILANASPRGAWHVALAIPDVTAWALKEPNFRARVQQAEKDAGQPRNKYDIAALIKEWSAVPRQFDRTAIAQVDDEFRELNEFVTKHVAATTGVA